MPPYVCAGCSAAGVKLWRQYQTYLENLRLLCCDCAASDQGRVLAHLRDDGSYETEYGRTDQIGWFVPAVPTEDGSFWGYTSVPQERVEWWKALPNRSASASGGDAL